MTELVKATAIEIMALIDEFPSEPLTFERKQLVSLIEDKLFTAWNTFENEAVTEYNAGYDSGFDEGYDEGYREAVEEGEPTIEELHNEIEDLKKEIESVQQQSFAEGYEAGLHDRGNVDSIEIR